MSFTAQELANISNAALDFYVKGKSIEQKIQEKPLLSKLTSKQKTFPGGKENIRINVKGQHSVLLQGYSHDDTANYQNPANIKQAVYPWKELHSGIEITWTELKKDGISVSDDNSTSDHNGAEMHRIEKLLDDKLSDMAESWAENFDVMLHKDGTQDAKEVPGVFSFLLAIPSAAGTTAGIDRTANTWWRNRANENINSAYLTGGAINAATASNQYLVTALQDEWRQVRRYGGRTDLILMGSDAIQAYEAELRSKGNYSDKGFAANGQDASIGDLAFKNVPVFYDPQLDDQGLSKAILMLDTKHLYLNVMDGEDKRTHSPTRPAEKYAMYRSMTWTGGMICDQLNAQGYYTIA